MKIYIASSWKNEEKLRLLQGTLIDAGNEVDLFCASETGFGYSGREFVFSFDRLPDSEYMNAATIFDEPVVHEAFLEDKNFLDWSDAVLLVLPSGKSAHLEAGYAAGAGKKLVIYHLDGLPSGEFDVMYGFAELITDDFLEVVEYFNQQNKFKAYKIGPDSTTYDVFVGYFDDAEDAANWYFENVVPNDDAENYDIEEFPLDKVMNFEEYGKTTLRKISQNVQELPSVICWVC